MSKPILYGTAASRALRSVWAMEETGIDYTHVPTHYFNDSKLGHQRDRAVADADRHPADVRAQRPAG